MVGRYLETDEGVKQFAWPASGVRARFVGSQVTAVIEDTGHNILDITVDGRTETLHLKPGRETYTVFEARNVDVHALSLTRRSEIFDQGLTGLVSLETNGRFLALPDPEKQILFLGDSISVGYGAEGKNAKCAYSAETGAPLRAWTALTAQAFGADWHNISISGRGLIRNHGMDPAPVMTVNFERTLPDHNAQWDHARWQPDLVIVNLGTNDFSSGDPGEAFTEAYVHQLAHIRDIYPEAYIYAAFKLNPSAMDRHEDARSRISMAVDMRKAAGDDKVSNIVLPLATKGRIHGCDHHPGLDSHRTMARAMIDRVKTDLDWKTVD